MMWLGAAVGRLTERLDLSVLRRWSLLGAAPGRVPAGGIASGGAGARRALPPTDAPSQARARAIPRPLHADWAWRPELWTGQVEGMPRDRVASGAALGREAKLFHDCPRAECAVRQLRHAAAVDGVAGIEIETGPFEGAFLSLAIDLPLEAVQGLSRRHLLGVAITCEVTRHLNVYTRINVRHGPNLAQVVRARDGAVPVDLDMALADLDEDRVTAAWVDLIFEAPAMNRITLGDVTLSRRPRAEF